MMIPPEMVMDCFLSWRNRNNSTAKSELVLLVSETPSPDRSADRSRELRRIASSLAALRPDGVIWNDPSGEAYRIRSERLAEHGAVLARIESLRADSDEDAACKVGLSKRESEVFTCLADGLNHKEIARKLFISSHTARKHIENIYAKLNVCNRIEAINKVRSRPLQSPANTANCVETAELSAGTNRC
jgi:DNA-binding CsgD family transcriptional regulator